MPENAIARGLMRLMVRGIRRVDEDREGQLMAAAVRDHEQNAHPEEDLIGITYRDDVLPQSHGTATVDTDGALRLVARATAPIAPPYWMTEPCRPFRREDIRDVTPGEMMEITFELFAISWLFRAGHCIRLAIAGADADNVVPIAIDERPVLSVHCGGATPSRVDLPVVAR